MTLTPTTPDSFSTPKGTIPPPVALIRPPRFNPANPKATTFPAMPTRYLDALQRFPEGNDEPPLLVRDLYEDSNNTLPA